jgi:hypothetical protein
LFGSVVFEFKGNLKRELGDVYARLPDYTYRARTPDRAPVCRNRHRWR